jgi:hypothetical protein
MSLDSRSVAPRWTWTSLVIQGVALASWEQFEALKEELISGHGFQDKPR